MYKIILFLFLFASLNANTVSIKPLYSLKSTSSVQDMLYTDNLLYTGSLDGRVNVFSLKQRRIIKKIKIPNIKDFMGDDVEAKIYSIDKLNNDILITSQGEKGYINIYLHNLQKHKTKKIISIKEKLFIRKAKFISANKIILATLSNEIILYNILNKKQIYKKQVSLSAFSDFSLNEDKTQIACTDESGKIRIYRTKDFNFIRELKNINLDKVFQLSYKNNTILSAGQDRKAVIYKGNETFSFSFDFLLYACSLNKDASLAGIAYNANNDVLIVDTITKKKLYSLTLNASNITRIIFVNNNTVVVSSNDAKINIYRIKK